ncbi:MAG: DUF2802 domain-containing protein [Thiohalomonadaceae bacterium]
MDSLWLIVIACLGVAALLIFVLLLQRRLSQQASVLHTMQGDLRALCNAAVSVGDRINQIERRQRQLAKQQEDLGLRQEQLKQDAPEERSYAQAIKLAHKGAGVDDLVEVCGLSKGEAELVAMMHRLGQQ